MRNRGYGRRRGPRGSTQGRFNGNWMWDSCGEQAMTIANSGVVVNVAEFAWHIADQQCLDENLD